MISADSFTIFPAVDMQNGKAVQLVQGVAGSEKIFGDPIAAAQRWKDDGAQWIHLVDLDAAFGTGDNSEIIKTLISELDINIELSGGIRNDKLLNQALEFGAKRVNIGTAAIENPKWCEKIISKYGDFIAISLDIRSSNLAGRGWTTEAGSWKDTLKQLSDAGCARFVVTDVGSDGMLSGPNFGLLSEVCEQTDAKIVASGGVSKVEDIKELKKFGAKGLEGVIIGTALYVGNFTLPEALAAASEKDESN